VGVGRRSRARRVIDFQGDQRLAGDIGNRRLEVLGREHGANPVKSYQSEREDWILTMVAAGMGVCFLPEYTATFPGVVGCLVSVAGRRWSPPVAAFVKRRGVTPGRRRQSP
jgi:DNA-binding transcriptional LysR family regulator